MKRPVLIMILVTAVFSSLPGVESKERFLTGVESYNSGEYRVAADIWSDLYDSGFNNFELLYNLGNAYFKLDDISMSILFYERALLRKPWDDDTRYNLSIAKTLTRDRYDTIPQIFLTRWFNLSALAFSSDRWAIMSLTCFTASLSFMLLFLFTSRYRLKRVSFLTALLLFIVSASALLLSIRNSKLVYNNPEAVIISPVITGRSAPSESGQELFVIHEGLKVKTGERIGEWCEIRLPDGNKGWVPVISFERI
jgi:tetratricopeptide (TPR) repeat protein